MTRKKFDVEVPDGQHLGFSRDTNGAYRAHLFDDETNDLVGHAELFEPDEDDADSPNIEYVYVSDSATTEGGQLTDEERDEAIAALISLGIIVAAAAAPHVKKWWRDKAVPVMKSASDAALLTIKTTSDTIKTTSDNARLTMKSKWTRFIGPRNVEREVTPAEVATAIEPGGSGSSSRLEIAFEDYRTRMSSSEARERFVAALLAKAFSEEQMRMLRNAKIEDDGNPPGFRAAVEALTPQQVGKTITMMLEKNPSLLDNESLTQLRTIFGASQADYAYAPLRLEKTRELPRLEGEEVGP